MTVTGSAVFIIVVSPPPSATGPKVGEGILIALVNGAAMLAAKVVICLLIRIFRHR